MIVVYFVSCLDLILVIFLTNLLCQSKNNEILFRSTEYSITKLKNTSHTRINLNDIKDREKNDRILETIPNTYHPSLDLFYHKSCYASYTSKLNISRLSSKERSDFSTKSRAEIKSDQNEVSTPSKPFRSKTQTINWQCCIFYQKSETTKLRNRRKCKSS